MSIDDQIDEPLNLIVARCARRKKLLHDIKRLKGPLCLVKEIERKYNETNAALCVKISRMGGTENDALEDLALMMLIKEAFDKYGHGIKAT